MDFNFPIGQAAKLLAPTELFTLVSSNLDEFFEIPVYAADALFKDLRTSWGS